MEKKIENRGGKREGAGAKTLASKGIVSRRFQMPILNDPKAHTEMINEINAVLVKYKNRLKFNNLPD